MTHFLGDCLVALALLMLTATVAIVFYYSPLWLVPALYRAHRRRRALYVGMKGQPAPSKRKATLNQLLAQSYFTQQQGEKQFD